MRLALPTRSYARDEHNCIIQLFDIKVGENILRLGHIHFSITDDFDFATPHLEETLDILKSRNEKRILMGDFITSHTLMKAKTSGVTNTALPQRFLTFHFLPFHGVQRQPITQ